MLGSWIALANLRSLFGSDEPGKIFAELGFEGSNFIDGFVCAFLGEKIIFACVHLESESVQEYPYL